jgi:hypothetical protein
LDERLWNLFERHDAIPAAVWIDHFIEQATVSVVDARGRQRQTCLQVIQRWQIGEEPPAQRAEGDAEQAEDDDRDLLPTAAIFPELAHSSSSQALSRLL